MVFSCGMHGDFVDGRWLETPPAISECSSQVSAPLSVRLIHSLLLFDVTCSIFSICLVVLGAAVTNEFPPGGEWSWPYLTFSSQQSLSHDIFELKLAKKIFLRTRHGWGWRNALLLGFKSRTHLLWTFGVNSYRPQSRTNDSCMSWARPKTHSCIMLLFTCTFQMVI